MPQPPRQSFEVLDFTGFMPNVDPRDIPPGAAEVQVNCCSLVLGELTVRRGLQEVTFEEE